MAIPKKLQGPLSVVPVGEEDATDYNGKMGALQAELMQSPEQDSKDELLAWGAGLTDPSGNGQFGGALASGNKAQLEQRNKNRELKSQYIPLIMNALGMQQQNAQLAKLTQGMGGAGGSGGIDLIGMDPNKLPALAAATGQKLSDMTTLWKTANQPDAMAAGTWQRFPKAGGGYDERWIADPKNPIVLDKDNNVSIAPGGAQAIATLAGATKQAETQATKGFEFIKGVGPDGTPYEIPLRDAKPEWFGNPTRGMSLAQSPAPTQPSPGTGARPQPRNSTSSAPMAPMAGGTAPAPGEFRGNFTGAAEDVIKSIEAIGDPTERRNAMSAYANQLTNANPAASSTEATPVATPSGTPSGAIQTDISPRAKTANKALEEVNTSFLKNTYEPTLLAGQSADKNLEVIGSARMALKGMNTGWDANAVTTASQILASLGVPQAKERAAKAEIFQSAANIGIQERLAIQKGPQTEQDASRDAATWATLKNTPKANAYILDKAQALLEREKAKADYFRKAMPFAQASGDLAEIDRRWAAKAPSLFQMPSMRRWNTAKE